MVRSPWLQTECARANLAKAGSFLRIQYHGYLATAAGRAQRGKMYTQSVGGAATQFQLGGEDDGAGGVMWVVDGVDEGMARICKGSNVTLSIPPALGFGSDGNEHDDNGMGDVPPGSWLQWDVVLVS